jgi:hypothetical protein
MSIKNGKRITKEVDGRNLTVVEQNTSNDRAQFLKKLLEFNKYEVIIKEETEEGNSGKSYTLYVTDLLFNATLKVYERSLKHEGGEVVSVEYWNQTAEDDHLPYFEFREKNPNSPNLDDFLTNPWAYRTIG